jgi:hypothetical protein
MLLEHGIIKRTNQNQVSSPLLLLEVEVDWEIETIVMRRDERSNHVMINYPTRTKGRG